MAKKRSKQSSGEAAAQIEESKLSVPTIAWQSTATASNSAMTRKSSKSSNGTRSDRSNESTLHICRNKHWRYISCYHGAWLQMPIEVLEGIANINYNVPAPRPMDPGSLFDIAKVRRLVDEATNLAVRAASDMASPTLTTVNGSLDHSSAITTLALGANHGAKLSRERKFRMREQACQKLGRAYRLDEIACSVATMQGSSPLEDIGQLVLQRSRDDTDAKYVHFFHEKIPSRQMAECTSLQPLDEAISNRPGEPEMLRTRALVKVFKEEFESAALDLTHAMSIYRYIHLSHKPDTENMQLQEIQRDPKRPRDIILAEKDQPSSFEGQLLFQRAAVYLTLACEHILAGLPNKRPAVTNGSSDETAADGSNGSNESIGTADEAEPSPETLKQQAESRKIVKLYAKRALKDYMTFISQFHYSPNYPIDTAKEYIERVSTLANGPRNLKAFTPLNESTPHIVYRLSDLFAAVPPSDIPAFPTPEALELRSWLPTTLNTCEWVTFHPLLQDALHSLLLCHLLLQTSAKELQRHAYMVARLVRIADGFPVFQSSRSPARADWLEVMRRAGNWLQLVDAWENLTSPAPFPIFEAEIEERRQLANSADIVKAAAALVNTEENRRKERIREQAILESLSDERVVDEVTFQAAVEARTKRAEEDHARILHRRNKVRTPIDAKPREDSPPRTYEETIHKWLAEDTKEYPILTDRAAALARWIRDAPHVTGTARRKKKPTKKGSVAKVNEVEEGVEKLELGE